MIISNVLFTERILYFWSLQGHLIPPSRIHRLFLSLYVKLDKGIAVIVISIPKPCRIKGMKQIPTRAQTCPGF